MTDNELLLAMSNIMDDKLKPVNDKLESMEQGQEEMSGRLERVEQNQEEMSGRLKRVEQGQEEMSGRLKRLEIDHENEILPRLQTIEKCYVSTYERYQEGVDQIQKMHDDISVIKYIVIEHSEKFQKLQVANS